jgi:hypothetical protein
MDKELILFQRWERGLVDLANIYGDIVIYRIGPVGLLLFFAGI